MKFLFVLLVVTAVVVGAPLMTITALNTLFGLSIEVTFMTWLSAFWLSAIVGGSFYVRKSK